jgi:hypothetical protein
LLVTGSFYLCHFRQSSELAPESSPGSSKSGQTTSSKEAGQERAGVNTNEDNH